MQTLQPTNLVGQAKNIYERLRQERDPFLRRSREAAALTIPSLQPEEHEQGLGSDLPEPYQSYGARGVNNLSSKLLLSLFPVNTKFFRLAVDEGALQQLASFKEAETEVQETLASIEDLLIDEVEATGLRVKLYEALRAVVACGNAMIHIPFNLKPRVFKLDSYCVERDPRGNVITIVVRQRVSPLALEPEVQRKVMGSSPQIGEKKWIEVHTVVRRVMKGGKLQWEEWQEIEGQLVDKKINHEFHRLPYIPLRMYASDGESYGRGHVEQYMGDLRALEGLSRAMQEGAAAAAKVLMLVNPDGVTRIRKLAMAQNGDFVPGRDVDVTPLQLQKHADFSVVQAEMQSLKRDLGLAFLLNSTVQRQAERVTAEEIRLVAAELEDTLGGTFSLLSAELQLPLVNIMLGNMQDDGRAPPLPEQVRPVIVTGLDAIGRGHDLRRLDEFLMGAMQTFGPQAAEFINVGVYLRQRAIALGIDTEELIKSDEQLAQERQAAQQAQMAETLGPTLMDKFPDATLEVAQGALGAGGA